MLSCLAMFRAYMPNDALSRRLCRVSLTQTRKSPCCYTSSEPEVTSCGTCITPAFRMHMEGAPWRAHTADLLSHALQVHVQASQGMLRRASLSPRPSRADNP